MRRVVVIGAGPAGGAAAMALANQPGIECVLLERRPIPRTKVCGSGLSPWTLTYLDELGVGEAVRAKAFRIDGAIIGSGNGTTIELRGDHETAVLLRAEFDQVLAEESARRGTELRDGVRVKSLQYDRGKLLGVDTSDGPIEADAVIDASGAKGNLDGKRVFTTLHTMLGWYEGVRDTSDVVELYFERYLAPHYGWIFPETATRVNIGLVFQPEEGGPNARDHFERFLHERLGERMTGATQLGKLTGHPVHASAAVRSLSGAGVLHAGEAGNLVDVATAEGIYHALVSGTLAGELLTELFASGRDASAHNLSPYTARVRRKLAARMAGGWLLMKALKTPVLDLVLRFGNHAATKKAVSRAFAGLYHG